MTADRWGQPVSTDPDTASLWDDVAWRHLTYRSGVTEGLRRVIAADPGFAPARAQAALVATMDGLPFAAATELAAARSGRAGTERERSFVAAVDATVSGGLWPSAPRWRAHHDRHPGDLLGLAMAVFVTSYGCGTDARERIDEHLTAAAGAVGDDEPILLGLAAMQAQERSDLDACHRLAARALELDPAGYVGGHPMAHVHFESGAHADGARWLDPWLSSTDRAAGFHAHLLWHSALHHLALGDAEATLTRLAACSAADSRLIDGASLLWRCQLDGLVPRAVDPARPPLARAGARYLGQVPFAFAGLHAALALATSGDADSLRRLASSAAGSPAPGVADVVPALAEGLADFLEGEPARAARRLLGIEPWFARIGGSHAQREVLDDTLIHVLIRAGLLAEARTRLHARLDRRPSPQDTRRLALGATRGPYGCG